MIPHIPADRTTISENQTNKPPDKPSLDSIEGGLFGALFGFHKKVMGVLRAANFDDEIVRIAGERIHLLMDKATEESGHTKDLNVQPRLDSMYEEVQRMVEELSERETIRGQMERIYGETPPGDIPWNNESPPKALVDMVETGMVQPCKTIDMGCGAGNYAIYLSSVGFDVTGVDISPSAIALAEANAKQKGVKCRFVAADVLGRLTEISETFEFAYDWSLLHHIFPNDRTQYVETVHRLLAPGGKYLSVCFSEKDIGFGGTGRFRMTSIGTELYFSSEDELRDLFGLYFEITKLKTIQVKGKREPHLMNWAFMTKQ